MSMLRIALILSCVWCFTNSRCEADTRPNIIVIMCDDMGFSDLGCYGGEIPTPHLDRLAANGLRFTDFHNNAKCSETRASLMTGLWHQQSKNLRKPGHVTMAEVLKKAGYRTYMSGKWHVTKVINPKTDEDKHNWPLQRGFDQFYGTIHGAGSFFDPNTLTRGNQYVSPFADPQYTQNEMANGEFYYTDAIADHASRFIHDHHQATEKEPFFLYVAFTAAHWPMHALEKDIAKGSLSRYNLTRGLHRRALATSKPEKALRFISFLRYWRP